MHPSPAELSRASRLITETGGYYLGQCTPSSTDAASECVSVGCLRAPDGWTLHVRRSFYDDSLSRVDGWTIAFNVSCPLPRAIAMLHRMFFICTGTAWRQA